MNTNEVLNKLKAEIERLLKCTEPHRGEAVADGSRQTLYWIKDFITTLQQEQPLLEVKETIVETGGIRGNLEEIPSNVDLELDNHTIMEEIRKCGCNPNEFDVARHFYELGRARKEK